MLDGRGGRRAKELSIGALFLSLLVAAAWVPLTDFAEAQGDTLEYQSIGANWAMGVGFPRFGLVKPPGVYRFTRFNGQAGYYDDLMTAGREGGRLNFVRAPGYPLFLGAVYWAFGVRPLVVKRLQLAMVLLIAGSLPLIGHAFWGAPGALAGLLAAPLYVLSFGRSTNFILAETLSSFSLWLLLLAWPGRCGRMSPPHAAMLGALTGAALLVKATSVFLAPLLLGLLARRDGGQVGRRAAAWAGLGLVIALAPYSVFASRMVGRPVILSTQGPGALLDDNNEIALRRGEWAKDWRSNPAALYNQPGWRELPAVLKVARFYATDWTALPRALKYKFDAGLGRAFAVKLVLCLLLLDSVLSAGGGRVRRACEGSAAARLLLLSGAGAFALGALLDFVGGAALVFAAIGVRLCTGRAGAGQSWRAVPAILWAYMLNFAMIFSVFDGNYRFVSAIEWLALLLACALGLNVLADVVRLFTGQAGPLGLLAVPEGSEVP